MPSVQDHPLRLLRIRLGLTQAALAKEAGITRAAVAAVEEGRVRNPAQDLIMALSVRSGMSVEAIEQQLAAWASSKPVLSKRAVNTLALPTYVLGQYASFAQWRKDIAPTVTAFASLAKCPRSSVARYEKGQLAQMPQPLINALYYLGASPEYVAELMNVPNGYDA